MTAEQSLADFMAEHIIVVPVDGKTDLQRKVEDFQAKYPDDVELEWKGKQRKVERPTLRSEFGDLAHMAEKLNRAGGAR